MSTIGRFKKKGGFNQLLELIETSGISKQEKFLALIEAESPAWSRAIKEKMLTVDKIFSANDEVIKEIFSNVKDLSIAAITFGLSKERSERLLKLLELSRQRAIKGQIETLKPSESEITTAFIQVFAEVRRLASSNRNLLVMIDPSLAISETLENELLGVSEASSIPAEVIENRVHSDNDDEVFRLRRIIKSMQEEMDKLKSQNADLKMKVEKIQKLVS